MLRERDWAPGLGTGTGTGDRDWYWGPGLGAGIGTATGDRDCDWGPGLGLGTDEHGPCTPSSLPFATLTLSSNQRGQRLLADESEVCVTILTDLGLSALSPLFFLGKWRCRKLFHYYIY